MDRSRQPAEGASDNLKLKFLALMCQLRPDRVVMALKTYIFPLEESLAICEKYKNLHGQAHIKSRTRAIDSAIKIYMEIMRQSFDKYMEHVEAPEDDADAPKSSKKKLGTRQAKDFLADGLFAYQMIVEICKKEIDELFEDGVKYFNLFLNFIFDVYEELDKKEDSLLTMAEEQQSRYVELRSFVKSEIFDDFLVVFITRVGTPGLIEVIEKRKLSTKLKDFEGLMSALVQEKDLIHSITGTLLV